MVESRRIKPRKALTRKDFRYKRDWRNAKENEQKPKDVKTTFSNAILLLYSFVTVMSIFASFTHGLKTGIGTCFILLIGAIMNVLGLALFERKRGLLFITGFLLILSSFAVMLYEAYFWR